MEKTEPPVPLPPKLKAVLMIRNQFRQTQTRAFLVIFSQDPFPDDFNPHLVLKNAVPKGITHLPPFASNASTDVSWRLNTFLIMYSKGIYVYNRRTRIMHCGTKKVSRTLPVHHQSMSRFIIRWMTKIGWSLLHFQSNAALWKWWLLQGWITSS